MLFGKCLNKYYRQNGILFLIGISALIFVDIVQLLLPQYLGEIVDKLSGHVDSSYILSILKKILFVGIAMFFGRMIWRFSLLNASSRIESGLRQDMFQKSERLAQEYYHLNKTGSIMSWFTTDLEQIEEFMGFGTVTIVDGFFMSVLVIIKLVSVDWVLACIALMPMVLIVFWGAMVEKFMAMKWEQRQEAFDSLYDFAQENFTGIRVIKAFIKETSELHSFARIARKNEKANVSFARVSIIFDVLIELIIAAIFALVLGLGGFFVYLAVDGSPFVLFGHVVEMTPGGLTTFTGYLDALIWPMIAMGQVVTMRGRAKASLKRVESFLNQEETVKDDPSAKTLRNVTGQIHLEHLSFDYAGNKDEPKLKDVSLTIRAGEMVGVVGKVGSGKSTLFLLLMRLYNVDPGTIFIDDQDIMTCTVASVREAVSYVPQDVFLFSDTVEHNIGFADTKSDIRRIQQMAIAADIHENIRDFKDGYQTMTGERGVTLSGGQKQRISIARAFLKDAPILIMDDPVSSVDMKTEETILANIRENRQGKTTIIIASRISTVESMDRILVMNNGEVEAFDTPANLMKVSPTYQKMVLLQQLEKEAGGEV